MSRSAAAPAPGRSTLAQAAPWILLALLVAWIALLHHGIGPARADGGGAWFEPRHAFFEHELGAALLDPPWLAFATLGGLAAILALGVWLTTRSALARAAALSALAAALLFLFYGLLAPFPWRFFGWRGSVVLLLVALCFGIAASAPVLAESWLQRPWPQRIALYLPFAAFAIGFLCNATGTDPALPFALSPWPAVPVFGIEVGVLLPAIVWLGTAAGLTAVARARRRPVGVALAIAAGLGLPLALLAAGSGLGLFPFRTDGRMLAIVAGVCGTALAAAAAPATLRIAETTQHARARRIGVGAALLAIPLVSGQALAQLDYWFAREIQARRVIDALDRYYARESLYPDALEALVTHGPLEEIPEPSLGLGLGDGEGFRYQGFGTSYLLEFTATRWVQCAYTPAPVYDEEERLEEDFEQERLEESWSCPSRPPELW